MLSMLALLLLCVAMSAEVALGIATAGREGRLTQENLGKVHPLIGYFTFAALAIGFGALAF
jgi:hypothetical protein